VNRGQFVSLILSFAFLGVQVVWTPASAEEVEGQEQDVALYLYSSNGIGRLHTRETVGHGDIDQVTIEPGGNAYFGLNISLQADLPVKSYRTDIGFHIYLDASSTNWEAGHLNIFIRDSNTHTGGSVAIAEGDINIPAFVADEEDVDIPWTDGYGPEYNFNATRHIVLELENDGTNAVQVNFDTDDARSRLVTVTNPIRDITVFTKAYNLGTSAPEDLTETDNFKPNLPTEISKMFISGNALSAFGTYDITEFKVQIFDSDDDRLFEDVVATPEPEGPTGTNEFADIIWNYNDPGNPSEKHKGKGIYTVRISAINQQSREFSLEKSIQMDAYGVYLYTSEPDQSVAVGGKVEYQIFVMNAGDVDDEFTIVPSETSDNWDVDPPDWTSSRLDPGYNEAITFTISVSDSTEMVGKSAVVVFTGESVDAVVAETFDLETKTSVGAEYEVGLYFEDVLSGQAVSKLDTTGVAGEWNQYVLSVANLGQAIDSVQLLAPDVPSDWKVRFVYGDLDSGSITIDGIPRLGVKDYVVNVTVLVRPAQSEDNVESADIELIALSQGNTSKSDTAILSITRTFGLVLSVTPQGSSGIFVNKEAGEQFEIDLLLESLLENQSTFSLDIPDLPAGWSYNFKEDGATVTETSLEGSESKPLDLFITVGSQAIYNEDGYSFDAMAEDLDVGNTGVLARLPITVFLRLDSGFELSSLKYRETLEPGESYTFQLNIDNKANGDDKFTLSASSVPSGWRVVFLNGNTFDVEAARSITVPIQVTVGDEARDGDEESVTITVASQLANQEKQQNFVIEVEQGFTERLFSSFADLWYIFVFLGLIIVIGTVTYYRQEDYDWDEDYSEGTDATVPRSEESSDDEWDEWN